MDKEYAKAARILGDLDDPLYLAKVDASKNPTLVKKYNIRQFPSILFIRNGIAVEYNWGLKADDFVEVMQEKAGPIAEMSPILKALFASPFSRFTSTAAFFACRINNNACAREIRTVIPHNPQNTGEFAIAK